MRSLLLFMLFLLSSCSLLKLNPPQAVLYLNTDLHISNTGCINLNDFPESFKFGDKKMKRSRVISIKNQSRSYLAYSECGKCSNHVNSFMVDVTSRNNSCSIIITRPIDIYLERSTPSLASYPCEKIESKDCIELSKKAEQDLEKFKNIIGKYDRSNILKKSIHMDRKKYWFNSATQKVVER